MIDYVDKHTIYKQVLLDGCSIEFGQISVCYLSNYYHGKLEDHFQVHSDHHKAIVSELYHTSDKAIRRFLELKKKCYGGRNDWTD